MRGQKCCRNSQKIELENFARWKNALNSGYKNVTFNNFTRERRMRKTQYFFAVSVSSLVSHMVGSASRSAMPRGTIYQEVHIKKAFSLLGQSAGKTIRNLKPKKLKFPHSFANGFLLSDTSGIVAHSTELRLLLEMPPLSDSTSPWWIPLS